MTEIHRALMRFWSNFGIHAYVSGHVPQGAELPYITFEVVQGDCFYTTVLTAHNWHIWHEQTGIGSAMHERATLMDEISNAIPASGRMIRLETGLLVLGRDVNYQSYYDDPDDEHVIGGRTAYTVRFITQ